jgi:hypothetical protein
MEKARLQQKGDSGPFSEKEYDILVRNDLNGQKIKNRVIRA